MAENKSGGEQAVKTVIIIVVIILILYGTYKMVFNSAFNVPSLAGLKKAAPAADQPAYPGSHPTTGSQKAYNTGLAVQEDANAVNAAAGAIGGVISLGSAISAAFGGGGGSAPAADDPDTEELFENVDGFDARDFFGIKHKHKAA